MSGFTSGFDRNEDSRFTFEVTGEEGNAEPGGPPA